ncbi:MAG: GNAT family N-acetyltransferase [Thermoplasmata archaeon]
MNRSEILALFDRQMRSDPAPEPGVRIERVGRIVRAIGPEDCILFSDLGTDQIEPAILEQVSHFRSSGRPLEWKVYSHDRPPELRGRLIEHGFVPDETESLMIQDLGARSDAPGEISGLEIRRVTDLAGLREAAAVSSKAFGKEDLERMLQFEGRLTDPTFGLFIAYLDGAPVSAGRVELPKDRSFASIWGGGTAPEFRHRGIYRAMVAARAQLARDSGHAYLAVEALETSRPILQRLGFVKMADVTGFVLRPAVSG